MLAAMALSAALFLGVWALVLTTRGDPKAVPTAAPIVFTTPPPTGTALPVTAPATAPIETPLPTAARPVGTFPLGSYVQVVGTGGDGLSVRVQPGINNTVNFLGLENEIFVVRDGPVEADGYVWWYLINPYNENQGGWAVQDFLQASQSP